MPCLRVLLALTIAALVIALVVWRVRDTAETSARIEERWPPLGRCVSQRGRAIHFHDVPAADPSRDDVPVIFIHGASGNLRDQHSAFEPIVRGRFRAIYVDRPGAGYTDRCAGDDDPHAQAAVVRDLLDRLGIERAVICGHSYGAGCAATFGVDFPSRTAALMLLAPAAYPWPGDLRWTYRLAALPGIRHLVVHTVVMGLGLRLIPPGVEATFAPDDVSPGYTEAAGIPLMLRVRNFIANADDILAIKRHASKLCLRYREIVAPTLIVSGRSDQVVRHTIHATGLHRAIAGSRLIEVDAMGHKPDYVMTRTICEHLTAMVDAELAGEEPQVRLAAE